MEPKPRPPSWIPPDPTTIVIPGIDPTASTNEQIDKIDQLITIRLQNVDANFSKIQQLIATRLLPAFRKYAEGTEPVREAAKFWKSFYEAAAQVRIPLASDTTLNMTAETSSDPQGEENESGQRLEEEGNVTDPSYDSTDTTPVVNDSFMHGVPISSTPLIRDAKVNQEEDSWSASIESPFERLHRQVQSLTIENKGVEEDLPDPSFVSLSQTRTSPSPPPPRHSSNLPKAPTDSPPPLAVPRSRSKGKTPLRENILRQNARLASSQAVLSQKTPRRKLNASKAPEYDSDSSDDLIPPGMSPPVTMQFAVPARLRTSPVKLSLTPAKKAAEKIGRDYVASAASQGLSSNHSRRAALEPSISSLAPSIPSITKWMSTPNVPSTSHQNDGIMTPAHQIYKSRAGAQPQATRVTERVDEPLINLSDDNTTKVPSQDRIHIMPKSRLLIDDEASLSPGSDSDLSEHDEQNPSNGFLYATQNNAQVDDSFSDDGDDSIADIDRPGDQLHPVIDMFAQFGGQNVDDSFDQDSFSDNEEETIFGGRQAGQGPGGLNIRNDPLIDETHTGAVSLNPFAQVEQSPTPYVGQMAPSASR